MTPIGSLDPDPSYTLRLVGITMLICTLKIFCVIAYLNRKRKRAREEDWERVKITKGVFHSADGVEERLQKKGNPEIAKVKKEEEARIALPAGLQLQERCTI